MDEVITWRVIVSLSIIVLIGIYIVKKIIKDTIKLMQSESLELSFLSIIFINKFFSFLLIHKISNKILGGFLFDDDF